MADGKVISNSTWFLTRLSLYVLLATVVILLFVRFRGCNDHNFQLTQYEQMLKDSRDSTAYAYNDLSEEVYSRTEVQGDYDNLEKLLSRSLQKTDSLERLAARFNVKAKNIQSFAEVTTNKEDDLKLQEQSFYKEPWYLFTEIDPGVLSIDTTLRWQSITPHWQRFFLTGTFVSKYDSSIVRLGDSAYNRIYSKDTLDIVTAKKSKGSIFNRTWYSSFNVIGRNPNTSYKIEGAYSVDDRKPGKWFMVGYAGLGYDLSNFSSWKKPKPVIGVGVARVLFRIK